MDADELILDIPALTDREWYLVRETHRRTIMALIKTIKVLPPQLDIDSLAESLLANEQVLRNITDQLMIRYVKHYADPA